MRSNQAQVRASQLIIDCCENYDYAVCIEFVKATQIDNELFDYYYSVTEKVILLRINEQVLDYEQDDLLTVQDAIDITICDLIEACEKAYHIFESI